jgi:hypothetical protein
LFQLDEYRYASLINLLIQLRRPQLTRQLDENDLSRSLSEALPPVSPASDCSSIGRLPAINIRNEFNSTRPKRRSRQLTNS